MKTYSEQISHNGGEKSIFLQQDSPVSLFLVPDQEKERKMTATSGRKCLGELTKSDPIGLLVKTLLESTRIVKVDAVPDENICELEDNWGSPIVKDSEYKK